MRNEPSSVCRMEGCGQHVPDQLMHDRLCLEHFVEHTYARAQHAVESYQQDLPFRLDAVQWMFEDAKFSLMALLRESDRPYREGLSELMVCLANLHEYVRYHADKATQEKDAPMIEDQTATARAGRSAA
jgi:hypothetical protein